MTEPIYLDNQATTPLAPEVFEAMVPWLRDNFGNPHSPHILGRKSAAAVEVARQQVCALLPNDGEMIFTGSATEAINLGFGAVKAFLSEGRNKIVVLVSEHAAVRDTALSYQAQGFEVILHPVGSDGLVSMEQMEATIDQKTALVAAMLVNNEIGVIQPVGAITDIAHKAGALMFCDAVQGYGRVAIPTNIDMIALSGHKIYGPKGIGALWVKNGLKVPTLIHGGGQERGVRSGTLSPALCVGLGKATELCADRWDADAMSIANLAKSAREKFANWTVNGSQDQRYPGNLNIRRDGLDVARLMSDVRGVAFSAGSACASGSGRPSHVLAALGLQPAEIKSSIRLGFGRYTTVEEIEQAASLINRAAEEQL
ncbi:cysteine desulfurase family protein [Parasphingorhabdus halotolerans]|uniref:Cysteine desulfurase n=1 Tax=Parasphingorhabdus halotolerans TaxID=2725558 RepID=A0A6H2DKA9_9SPHN|nr:cysteine desulfurase family protein [Parasphingorhabdus halotolerans]QJB68423.1 cysteine desulfurase [Parasphingorhabdus halotolerans]